MIVLAATNCSTENADVQDFLATWRESAITSLRSRLDQGVTDGELSPDANTEVAARFYNATLQDMSVQARDSADRTALEAIAERAMAAWETVTQ